LYLHILQSMKIEDEIKQPKFKNEYQKAFVNLIYTGNWVHLRTSVFLKKYGLTLPQFNVLRILRGQHPGSVSVNEIIGRMLDKMSNASRIVDKLVAKKLADRKECPKDRRQVDVLITKKGIELLEKIDMESKNREKNTLKLNLTETKELNRLLDKLRG
jgi:DNA-binding MarR family transcriptional regulator